MSLVKPSVSQKNREIRRKPRSYFPKSSFSFISRNPSHFPKSLNSRIRSSPTRGIHVFGKAFGFTKNREIRRMPRPYFLKSQFSIVSRNPDLIIPNSLFPVIRDLHGAAGPSWFRSRNELVCCAAGAKKNGVFTTKKGGNA